jgi:hypothetical protein
MTCPSLASRQTLTTGLSYFLAAEQSPREPSEINSLKQVAQVAEQTDIGRFISSNY